MRFFDANGPLERSALCPTVPLNVEIGAGRAGSISATASRGFLHEIVFDILRSPPIPMPTTLRRLRSCLPLLCGLSFLAAPLVLRAAELSEADSKFMVIYEQLLKALVNENLNAAKDAAHALPNEAGADVLKSSDLKGAREAFVALSDQAEKIVAGNPAYHVFYCPMVKHDWVEQSTTIANPYMGRDMLTCGVEKKNEKKS